MAGKTYETVKIEKEDGITWAILNRPEKRNAMSPQMHFEMDEVMDDLDADPETKVLVLTGAGESWCAGQDLKLFFRELDGKPAEMRRVAHANHSWRWDRMSTFSKPTIAMVNGYVFGGAFTQLCACDIAIAAEDAKFGLSEVNWGILPGGIVSKVMVDTVSYRDALYYAMTGDPFDGKKAAEMRLVNFAVPREKLRDETVAMARKLMEKNPAALRATKEAIRAVRWMSIADSLEYLDAKGLALRFVDAEGGREQGLKQFLDDKTYRPGAGNFERETD